MEKHIDATFISGRIHAETILERSMVTIEYSSPSPNTSLSVSVKDLPDLVRCIMELEHFVANDLSEFGFDAIRASLNEQGCVLRHVLLQVADASILLSQIGQECTPAELSALAAPGHKVHLGGREFITLGCAFDLVSKAAR